MPYNLPPPWDPGFALPDNVVDEGLERHAYVTDMMPRGTYDQHAKVGTGGYVVPQYVIDEGLGRGTYTTKMMPRGTYVGPRVPHYLNKRPKTARAIGVGRDAGKARIAFSGLGGSVPAVSSQDVPLPEPFESFGRKAAAGILANVAAVPPVQRTATLRKVMDHIDKTLWPRTLKIAARFRAGGMSASDAFAAGLARACGAGLAAEMVHKGRKAIASGKSPAPDANTMLGVGYYNGRMGLGDATPATAAAVLRSAGAVSMAPIAASLPLCLPNPPPGYTWDGSIRKFRPVGPGELAVKNRNVNLCVQSSDLTDKYHGKPALKVGPFTIPTDAPKYSFVFQDPSTVINAMPKDWRSAIQAAFSPTAPGKDPGEVNKQTIPPDPNQTSPTVLDWLGALQIPQPIDMNVMATPQGFQGSWYDWLPGAGVVDAAYQALSGNAANLTGPPQPFLKFTHPNGDDWGGWISLSSKTTSKGIKTPIRLTISFGKIPDSPWYDHLLEYIYNPVVDVVSFGADVVTKTLQFVGGLVCDVASSPVLAQAGGAAAGAAVGGVKGAQAGQAGGALAAQACAGPMVVPPPQTDWTIPLLVAGGVGLVAYLATRKKKGTP